MLTYMQQSRPLTRPPPIDPLLTVVVGKHDLTLETHSVQDLEALSNVALLWDVRDAMVDGSLICFSQCVLVFLFGSATGMI